MKKRKSGEKGFTLIEVIVTLVLVGITAALAGMWIVSVASGYVFTKMNANTVQKAQLAVTRLAKEFAAIKSVDTNIINTNATKISYTRTDASGSPVLATVSSTGNALQLNVNNTGNNTLTDSVSSFALTYCDNANSTGCPSTWTSASRIIEISLTLTGANNTPSTFVQRVTPRNL